MTMKCWCLALEGLLALLIHESVAAPLKLRAKGDTLGLASLNSASKGAVDTEAEFDRFLEDWFDNFLARKPMEALRFGRQLPKCRNLNAVHVPHIWGDSSSEAEAAGIKADQKWLADMEKRFRNTIGARDLSDERHVSYVLQQSKAEEMRQEHIHRAFRPPFGPLGCQLGVMGCQVQVLGMLKGLPINTVDDARCYLALLNGLPDFLLGHAERLQEATGKGFPAYRAVLEAIVQDCDAQLPARDATPESTELFLSFKTKLAKVSGISSSDSKALLKDATKAVEVGVWPAYRNLRKVVVGLLPKSLSSTKGLTSTHGSTAKEFYVHRVKLLGVGADPASLHKQALQLVERTAEEMKASSATLSIHSTASSDALVMKDLRTAYTQARYEDSAEGRAAYLQDVEGYIDMMWQKLREASSGEASSRLFYPSEIPVLPCLVKPIDSPSFPGLAQYAPGSIGESNRSAVVSFNIHDMSKVSKMDEEVLAYHEVVPGHHLQVTKALTLPLPSFRRYFGDEAFAEGWAVYAEQDISPRLVNLSTQSRLGRLNMRQTRNVRMAVDTGIHALDWDRRKAEEYYMEYTMITPERAAQAVDRHFAWPAQALTYAAGYEEVKRVRQTVIDQKALLKNFGKDWEAMFHKAVVSHGDLPLAMLEKVVFSQLDSWASVQTRSAAGLPALSLGAAIVSVLSLTF